MNISLDAGFTVYIVAIIIISFTSFWTIKKKNETKKKDRNFFFFFGIFIPGFNPSINEIVGKYFGGKKKKFINYFDSTNVR